MPGPIEVRLNVVQRSTYMSASCPEVPGLHVVGADQHEIRAVAMEAVKDLFLRNRGQQVEVAPTDRPLVLRVLPLG